MVLDVGPNQLLEYQSFVSLPWMPRNVAGKCQDFNNICRYFVTVFLKYEVNCFSVLFFVSAQARIVGSYLPKKELLVPLRTYKL